MITDFAALKGLSPEEAVRAAIRGGADVIQLRDKKAPDAELIETGNRLRKITGEAGVPLLVNDRAEVARVIDADGLHLGQDDGPLSDAKKIFGEGRLYGRSTHSEAQAAAAAEEGFDYIGIGPVFSTPTKPGTKPVGLELVRFAAQNVPIPFVAIGGIDERNVQAVVRAGAKTVAVVRAVMGAQDPETAARNLTEKITHG